MASADTFFSPCPRGLEQTLADELASLGALEVRVAPGGVHWAGERTTCYRANLWSRIASRVLLRIGAAPYHDEDDLYRAAFALDWPARFEVACTLRVDVTAIRSPLRSVDFALLRVKDAICDRFREATGARPSIDTRNPDVRVSVFLDAGEAVFYLDTSGEPLFKRGYRQARREAPLKENLAAGLIALSGWQPATEGFIDPMCGSGTIALEAALIATGTAPGIRRRFGFEALRGHDASAWKQLQTEARQGVRSAPAQAIVASDRSREAVSDLRASLEHFGLGEAVRSSVADVSRATAPCPSGVWLTNPPYGVRLGADEDLTALFRSVGTTLKQQFAGWHCYFISADMTLPRQLGLKESRRTPLYNGRLECRLFEFRMFQGSLRPRS